MAASMGVTAYLDIGPRGGRITVTPARRRGYVVWVALLAAWAAALVTLAVTFVPDLYWMSYYSVDYTIGFVRRGLAGELTGLFPDEHYFTGLTVLRWLPTVVYTAALAAVAWTVAIPSGHSERRLLMTLLIPVLPFGFAFGVFSARPDLLGAAALALFAVALNTVRTDRALIIVSGIFGAVNAVLTLIHEAIPFLFGLGVLVALAVLARERSARAMRTSAVLASGPGVLTALAVAALGRRGVSKDLCDVVPRGLVNWPAAGNPTPGEVLGGFRFDVDYHDWMCRNILPLYDQGFGDAVRFVTSIGPAGLISSTVTGAGLLVATLWLIGRSSGVPCSRMAAVLRPHRLWVLTGSILIVPVFMTGVDWIRWWVAIGLDIGIVYLIYASGQPEADTVPSRRTLLRVGCVAVAMALVPIGILPGFGAPVPM